MCKSSKMVSSSTRVIQVTNIAPQATKDQMQTLFGYLGKIDDIRLYPTIRDVACPVQSRICYIKYYDSSTVAIAQHMTNTVFIDRALIVIPLQSGEIPDEQKALEMSNNGTITPGFNSEPRLPAHVVNSLEGAVPYQVIQTYDPKLAAADLPAYPPLPATYDNRRIEEIRRTVLVSDTGSLGHQRLIDHFSTVGEVNYLRFCEKDEDKLKYALIEMTEQESIVKALQLDGSTVDGQQIKVCHATQAIVKPQTKSNEAAQREIEEAMCRVKEAQNLISAAIDPVIGLLSKDKRRTRSRSHSRRRSRSRSRRSRSRRSKRSRSRSRHRSRRSRSRPRHRTRSRSRHRSSRRSRSRSRTRSSRSKRDRSRDRDRKDKKDTDEKCKEKSKTPSKDVPKDDPQEDKPESKSDTSKTETPKPEAAKCETTKTDAETNGNGTEVNSSPTDGKEKEVDKKDKERSASKRDKSRDRSRDRKRDRSRSRRRSRSRSRRKRSRSKKRSRSRDRKRSRSRERKRSRSRDRKRTRSRDRKRSRSRDRKRTRSRDRKRTRSRDRKRSSSRSRRSRSTRDSKTPHDRKSRDKTPNLSVIAEKDVTVIEKAPDLVNDNNSPDNMDISNSP